MWSILAISIVFAATQPATKPSGSEGLEARVVLSDQEINEGEGTSIKIQLSTTDTDVRVMNDVGLRVFSVRDGQRIPLKDATIAAPKKPSTRRASDFFKGAIWPIVDIECPYDPRQSRRLEKGAADKRIFPEYVAARSLKEIRFRIPAWALVCGECKIRIVLVRDGVEISSSPCETIRVSSPGDDSKTSSKGREPPAQKTEEPVSQPSGTEKRNTPASQ
jgi:hypothetical protein